ncbi:MAG: hypothetical protein EOM25_04870 [Deltaproteobacteria bacterium]|nr:hypothetical protein [Deltaproteobacteria bacterium]
MRCKKIFLLLLLALSMLGTSMHAWAEDESFGIMRFTREEFREFAADHEFAPHAPMALESSFANGFESSLNLLSYLQYTPSEHNQGQCGNCWAWAGTGAAAIDLNVQKGVKDRLSVQYISACNTAKTCCQGGWLADLATFYTSKGYIIPWSNTNAYWQNGDGNCNVSCASIGTSPNYPITSFERQAITTHNISQAQAIANIKSILNQNKAVWFAFFLPKESNWTQFYNFWGADGESTPFSFDFTNGQSEDGGFGGHAVLCVGYDETSWIMLNSWGSNSGRPNGLFRVPIDMNYNLYHYEGDDGVKYASLFFQYLDITWGQTPTASYTYYIPYLIENTSGAWTGLGLRNLSTSATANVTARYYAQSGAAIGTNTVSIDPRGHNSFIARTSYIKAARGWIKVESTQELRGVALFTDDTATYMGDMDFVPSDSVSKNMVLPHFGQDKQWDTSIYMINPNSTFASTVTLTKRDDSGASMGSETYTLSAMTSAIYPLSDFGSYGIGSVDITTSLATTGFALFTNKKTGKSYFAGLMIPAVGK